MKWVVTLSFLLSFGALLQPALASAAGFSQDMRSTPLLTRVKCWNINPNVEGGGTNDSCTRPWAACLEQIERKFGPPENTGGRPQTNGSQPFYDKCDAVRRNCEEKYCR